MSQQFDSQTHIEISEPMMEIYLFPSPPPKLFGPESTHHYLQALTAVPETMPQRSHHVQQGQSSQGAWVQSTGGQGPITYVYIHQSGVRSHTITCSAEITQSKDQHRNDQNTIVVVRTISVWWMLSCLKGIQNTTHTSYLPQKVRIVYYLTMTFYLGKGI